MKQLKLFIKRQEAKDEITLKELLTHLKIEIPEEPPEGWKVVEWYWLEPNVSAARILTDGKMYFYELIEPPLTQKYEEILQDLKERILEKVPYCMSEDDRDTLFKAFLASIGDIEKKTKEKIPLEDLAILWYYIERDSLYAGRITPLLKDPLLEDISCSGYNKPIYVYHRNYESIPTNITMSEDELDSFVLAVAQRKGVELSVANPIADTTLYDGSRINLTFRSEVTDHGSTFTIRKIRKVPITPIQLVKWGSFSPEELALLWVCLESNSSMLFVGGTAAGKTTAMNAVALFIPIHAKVVTIEDTREVILPHKNWIPGVATGKITMFDLLKAALRQRPEYIIVGEVRGKEVEIMFQAMGLGHTCLSTVHGSSADGVLDRLMGPPYSIPPSMIQNLDIVVVVGRYKLGESERIVRRCRGIWLVEDNTETSPIYEWDGTKDVHKRVNLDGILERIHQRTGKSLEDLRKEIERRTKFIKELVERDLDYNGFLKGILEYKVQSGEFYEG